MTDDFAARARQLWSLGEYERVAERLAPAAEALVEATGVTTGTRVLDVAAGTGNVTLAAAARGAEVTASDIAPAMIEKGRARTAAAGFDITWDEASAEDLPYPDASFDCVLSAFGAMFAPNPRVMTAELLRVVRPGGAVALTSWIQGGVQGACSDLLADELPAAAHGRVVPESWGDPEVAREHFAVHGADVTIEERTMRWVFESPEAWVELWEVGAPPVVAVRSALGAEAWAALRPRVLETVLAHGSETGEGFAVEPGYLLILARRPA